MFMLEVMHQEDDRKVLALYRVSCVAAFWSSLGLTDARMEDTMAVIVQ
jgi:hypothetical protein